MTNTPSQVLGSGKDLKVLLEETAPLGATRESLRSHLKQEVYPEEHTLKGSRSSQQRPREQSKAEKKSFIRKGKYTSRCESGPGQEKHGSKGH